MMLKFKPTNQRIKHEIKKQCSKSNIRLKKDHPDVFCIVILEHAAQKMHDVPGECPLAH